MADHRTARAAKAELRRRIAADPALAGLLGVGLRRTGDGWGLHVALEDDAPLLRAALPESVDGVPVAVEVVGTLEAG